MQPNQVSPIGINHVSPKSSQRPKEEPLQQLTTENYTEIFPLITPHSREGRFITIYFNLLENGKLPTSKIVGEKLKPDDIDINKLLDKINGLLKSYGYKALQFFPNKELARIYSAFNRLSSQGESTTIKRLAKEAGTGEDFVSRLLDTKDFSPLTDLVPGFKNVFGVLQIQAIGHLVADLDRQGLVEQAHKWQADS